MTQAGISLANPSEQGNFLIGLIAILIGGSMWGVYIVTGRRVASGGNSLDNLCIAVAVGWLVQSLFLGVPAVSHVIHPKSDATWALAPGGPWKLLALLFVISLMASFIPYAVEQITLRRTTSGAFSVMQSINPAMAVAVGLAFGEIPDTGEVIGVALVICAVIVTFSGDASLAKGKCRAAWPARPSCVFFGRIRHVVSAGHGTMFCCCASLRNVESCLSGR